MKKYLTLLAGAMFLTACYNDAEDIAGNNGYQPSTDAIAFEVNEDGVENATRASNAIFNDDALRGKSIGVFASYTGKLKYENVTVSPDFMYNQKLAYNGSAWVYAPVKYWPNGLSETPEYLSFFAYAPHEAAPEASKCITDISDKDLTGDPWLNYQLGKYPWPKDATGAGVSADQVDLLYATKKEGTTYGPWTDISKYKDNGSINIGISDKVKFTMKHALASIGNEITIKTSAELNGLIENFSTIHVYGIKIEYKNLTKKARLVLNSSDGNPNWKEIISGELTTNRTYLNMFTTPMDFDGKSTTAVHIPYLNGGTDTGGAPKAESTEGDGLFYIPMQVAGTPKATVTVTLYYRVEIQATSTMVPATPNPPAEATATFDLVSAPNTIDDMAGKKQGIALTLGKDYDLIYKVWTLGGTASEPSHSRELK